VYKSIKFPEIKKMKLALDLIVFIFAYTAMRLKCQ